MANMNNPFSRTTIAALVVVGLAIPIGFLGIAYFISVDVLIAFAPVLFLLFSIVELVFVSIFTAFYADSKGKSPWLWSIVAICIVAGILAITYVFKPDYAVLSCFLAPLLSILLIVVLIKVTERVKR